VHLYLNFKRSISARRFPPLPRITVVMGEMRDDPNGLAKPLQRDRLIGADVREILGNGPGFEFH
jgi:hypothetical protein